MRESTLISTPYPQDVWRFIEKRARTGFKNVTKARLLYSTRPSAILRIEVDALCRNEIRKKGVFFQGEDSAIFIRDFVEEFCDEFGFVEPFLEVLEVHLVNDEVPIIKLVSGLCSKKHANSSTEIGRVFLD